MEETHSLKVYEAEHDWATEEYETLELYKDWENNNEDAEHATNE